MRVTSSSNFRRNVISAHPERIYSLSEEEHAPIKYFILHLFRSDCNWSLLLMCPSAALSTPSDLLLSAIVHHCLPVGPGVFLLLLLLSAGCCCLLRPATHAPLLFRQDTNLQTLLALRSNLSSQGISCPMCSGETAAAMEMHAPVSLPDPKWISELHVVSCRCVHGKAAPFVHPHVLVNV